LASPERQGEIRFWGNIDSDFSTVRRVFNKLKKQYNEILVCYEAGPCGYGLYHLLSSLEIECIVVAPSRIAKSPTDRIKNDHRDAKVLAKLLRAGDLTCVWVPDPSHEAMRDLIRARSAAKKDSKKAKQRIQSMLLRTGRKYENKPWTKRHRIWVANQSFPVNSQQVAFEHYRRSLEQIEDRILQLDQEIQRLLPSWSLAYLVDELQALKGVGLVIAVNIVAEIGDFSRFTNPKQVMAFLGLIPGEHSSGGKVRRMGITKVGNTEIRRLLFEAAWRRRG